MKCAFVYVCVNSCGKVCLSLLGTWDGQQGEQWNETTSTVLQVRSNNSSNSYNTWTILLVLLSAAKPYAYARVPFGSFE